MGKIQVADRIANEVEAILADRIASRQIDRDLATSIAAETVATIRPVLEPYLARLLAANATVIALRPRMRELAKILPEVTGQSSPEKSPSTGGKRRLTGKARRKG